MINALPSEHILLESADAEVEAANVPGVLRERLTLANRVRRISKELTVYEHGYLGVREERPGYRSPERRFALRHIDPKPKLTRRTAKTALASTLCLLALGS